MLKPSSDAPKNGRAEQPPSGGCVLKLPPDWLTSSPILQPPSGGCVLKLTLFFYFIKIRSMQPPSGGCVLKPVTTLACSPGKCAAAFGRLCVETDLGTNATS